MQIVELHFAFPSSGAAPLAPPSLTAIRKATRRSIPRIAGVSATSTVWLSRCRPSARIVPLAAALCPMVERTQVTLSVGLVAVLPATATPSDVHRLSALRHL